MRSIKPAGNRTIVPLDEAMRRVEGYKPAEKQTEPDLLRFPMGSFEMRGATHENIRFDESMKRLEHEGFHRHLRPCEAFDVLTYHFYETSGGNSVSVKNISALAKEMLGNKREWLNVAVLWKDEKLIFYDDCKGLEYDQGRDLYLPKKLQYASKREYGLPNVLLGGNKMYIYLEKYDPQMIHYLYGRDPSDFPDEFGRPSFQMPEQNKVWPLCREGYSIRTAEPYAASRGVKINLSE